jgi:hypothetical protein
MLSIMRSRKHRIHRGRSEEAGKMRRRCYVEMAAGLHAIISELLEIFACGISRKGRAAQVRK